MCGACSDPIYKRLRTELLVAPRIDRLPANHVFHILNRKRGFESVEFFLERNVGVNRLDRFHRWDIQHCVLGIQEESVVTVPILVHDRLNAGPCGITNVQVRPEPLTASPRIRDRIRLEMGEVRVIPHAIKPHACDRHPRRST